LSRSWVFGEKKTQGVKSKNTGKWCRRRKVSHGKAFNFAVKGGEKRERSGKRKTVWEQTGERDVGGAQKTSLGCFWRLCKKSGATG